MDLDKKNKVLILIGMENSLEPFKKKINRENIIILQRYQPFISQPFDDLMRDILIAVYNEKVTEIIVAASTEVKQKCEDLFSKIVEAKGIQELETLDYLFKNSNPEFPVGSIKEWLAGGKGSKEELQKTVNMIKRHPLMPADIKVKELFIDPKEVNRGLKVLF